MKRKKQSEASVRMTPRLWRELGFINIDCGNIGDYWSHPELKIGLDAGHNNLGRQVRYIYTLDEVVKKMLYMAGCKRADEILSPIEQALTDVRARRRG